MKNDNAKEQIRTRADIVSVVGRYVALKSRGARMMGLCPFHKEKTPSFYVNPDMGTYYCFGCGKGGDVFTFVQEMEGVDFREALTMLADETGVELPSYGRRDDDRYGGGYDDRYGDRDDQYNNIYDERGERDSYDKYGDVMHGLHDSRGASSQTSSSNTSPRMTARSSSSDINKKSLKTELLEIHAEAAAFFYEMMKNNPQAVEFYKSRGLTAETVREFRLGYAPDAWSSVLDHLTAKKFSKRRIIESGLVVAKDNGSTYDRFRSRAIFPLCDLSGRVCAFAGRAMNADDMPKYLNSPETALYQKSKIMFGLNKAREAVRDAGFLIIVEGYMDHLTLYQAGVRNVAAVSGTAMTAGHAQIISRFTKKATLVFDGDRAGTEAARRAALALAPFDLQVSILTLPSDDDPDTFVKREGIEKFSETIASSSKLAQDFLIDDACANPNMTAHEKSGAVDKLIPYARALKDHIVRDDFLTGVAKRLRIDVARVNEKFNAAPRYGEEYSQSDLSSENYDGGVSRNRAAPLGKLEEDFLRILIADPKLIVAAAQYIRPENLTDPLAANVYSIILDAHDKTGDLRGLPEAAAGGGEIEQIIFMLTAKETREEHLADELVLKIGLLRKKYFKAHINRLREKLIHAGEGEKLEIMKEIKSCGEHLYNG